jgi:hypothetical protein
MLVRASSVTALTPQLCCVAGLRQCCLCALSELALGNASPQSAHRCVHTLLSCCTATVI